MNATIENENNIDIDDYFLLAIRNWNDQTKDYTAIGDSATSIKYFNNYVDAEFAFPIHLIHIHNPLIGFITLSQLLL